MKCDSLEEGGKSVIHLFYRDKDGVRIHERIDTFVPYFYVKSTDSTEDARGIELGIPEGVPLKRINTVLSTDVPKARFKYPQSWAAKWFFNKRYLVDKVPKNLDASPPIVLTLDTEEAHISGKYVMTNIGYYSSVEKVYHELYFPWSPKPPTMNQTEILLQEGDHRVLVPYKLELVSSEEELIRLFFTRFLEIDPDYIVGWNIQFDMKMFYDNSRQYPSLDMSSLSPMGDVHLRRGFRGRDEVYIGGRDIFDLCYAAVGLLPPQVSYQLRHIGYKFLGFIKKDYRRKIQWLRETDPDELCRYNTGDVYCCVALMEDKQLFNHFYERSIEAACNIDDTYPMHNWLLMLAYRRSRLILPTHLSTGSRKCTGPRLIDPVPGVHETVIGLDFKGLYPAIAKTWNMSPETLSPSGDLKVGNGISFYSKPEGVWVDLISYLRTRKDFYDKQLKALKLSVNETPKHPMYHRRNAFKIGTVASTGLFNWEGFCMFVPEILDSIFYVAREIVDWIARKLVEWGYRPLYGHTDSVFVKVNSFDDISALLDRVNKEVDAFCKSKGITEHHFAIECDYKCKSIFFDIGHNRYALITDKGELVIQGFEGKKVNVADLGRRIQNELFRIILETKDEAQAKKYVSNIVKGIDDGTIPLEELSYYHTLKREPHLYKKKPSAVRAIEFSNLFRGSLEYPILDPMDTHKLLPIKLVHVDPVILKGTNIDPKKVKLLAFDLDDDFKKFILQVHSTGKAQIEVNMEKIKDNNVTKRVSHVVEALQWDFKDVLPVIVKRARGKKKITTKPGQTGLDKWK